MLSHHFIWLKEEDLEAVRAKWYQFHQTDNDKDNDNEELDEIDMLIDSDVR